MYSMIHNNNYDKKESVPKIQNVNSNEMMSEYVIARYCSMHEKH